MTFGCAAVPALTGNGVIDSFSPGAVAQGPVRWGGGLPRGSDEVRVHGGVLAEGRCRAGGRLWGSRGRGCFQAGRLGFFPARAGARHIGGRLPRGPVRGFPRDSGVLLECRFLVDGLPCAERAPLHMGGFQRR